MPESTAETIPSTMPAVIAEITDYPSLVAALRRAREIRSVSFQTMDEIVTASDGYFSKVLAPNGSRRLTPLSLGWALGALGVKCLLVEDTEALARVEARLKPKLACMARDNAVTIIRSRKFFSKIGRKGALARNALRKRRKAAASHAARARWSSS
jgi:hypothetical protein